MPFTLRQLKDMDTIEVEEDLDKIIEWYNSSHAILKSENVFLSEGVLKHKVTGEELTDNFTTYLYFKCTQQDMYNLQLYVLTYNYQFKNIVNFSISFAGSKLKIIADSHTKLKPEEVKLPVQLFIATFTYIAYIQQNKNTEVKYTSTARTRKSIKRPSNVAKKDKRVINLMQNKKVLYRLNLSRESAIEFKRSYIRHTASWSVRGYFRHYKSGKVIYVKPHTNGDRSQKTAPKTYKV